MQTFSTCPSATFLQHRPTNSVYRPCVTASVLFKPSSAAANVRPASQPQVPPGMSSSSLEVHDGRRIIVPSALSSGFTQLNFLEVVSTDITPTVPTYLTDQGYEYHEQFSEGLFALAGAVSPGEYADIIAALQTPSAQDKISQASTTGRVGTFSIPHADVIAERISKHPFFEGCTYSPPRGRLQGVNHQPSPHQDTLPYKYRVVVRFSADFYLDSYIDFYIPRVSATGRFKIAYKSDPDASLTINSGQGYIMSGSIGVKGGGNIIHHEVPSTFYGVSLIIDFRESSG